MALSVVAAAVIAVTIAFGRTYRGQHFPSDVAWGALLGSVWLAAAWRVVLRPVRPDRRGSGPPQAT